MAFQGFVNLLVRTDISLDERLMVCKTLADLSESSPANSLKISRTQGLPEAFSSILRESGSALNCNSSNRTDERHQCYIALCISRCSSKKKLDALGEGIHSEVCLKFTRTEGLVDGLWALKKHQESFVQICSAVALSCLCQCDEAVGINRRLMRYKWNSNVLQLPSAPPLRRSFGHAPADDLASQQGDMWRIEEERIPVAHLSSAGSMGAGYQSGAQLAAAPPASRFPGASSSSSAPPAPPPEMRAAGAHAASSGSYSSVPHLSVGPGRWDGGPGGSGDGGQHSHMTVEKEDSWASARETKPGAGYYSSQARCRSPFSSGHSSGPYGSGGGPAYDGGSSGSSGGGGGGAAGGLSAPPRMYSRTDVNFDPSSIKHCITIGSPSHPGARPGAGAAGPGKLSGSNPSPSRDLVGHRN